MMLQAISHRPLSSDAYALSDELFAIRIHTAKNDIKECRIYYGDRVCPHEPIDVKSSDMILAASDELFDYFEIHIRTKYTRLCYYFELTGSLQEKIYYSEYGFTTDMKLNRIQYFQFPFNRREDRADIPAWAADTVLYHIFPHSFASGRKVIKDGGTIRGITENTNYIKSLGINCIYLNPIFRAASYHKYDTIDYYETDPDFGSKEDFREMVDTCHKKGIRVILDGVFNHCGNGFFAFQDVIEKGELSEYRDWFYEMSFPVSYRTPPDYAAFAYVKEMPKLNTGNPEVTEYFCNVGKYWITEFDIDGWRLDVANEVNHDFWRSFRKAVRSVKPDALLIGEIWEDAGVWLMGDQFDSAMNYRFTEICRSFFAEGSIDIRTFDEQINHINMRYQENVTEVQMNFLDTHDVPRFMSFCKGDMNRFKLAVFYMMTATGVPSVFYGDERGVRGVSENEYRKPMPWNDDENPLTDFYSKCIRIRNENKALRRGTYRTVLTDDERGIYVFARQTDDEKIYVMLNTGESEKQYFPETETLFCDLWDEGKEQVSVFSCPKHEGRLYKVLR